MALDNPSYFSMSNPPPVCSLSSSVSSTSSCSSPRSQTKRSLRSLLRSLSTNSTDSNHAELFNTGAPRLSDIAPEFKYPLEPRRANSLKNCKNNGSHRRSGGIYSPLPTHEIDTIDSHRNGAGAGGGGEEDEVFLTHADDVDANVQYYNVNVKSAPRRHSISALRTTTTLNHTTHTSTNRSTIDLPQAIVHATIDGQSTASSLASRINIHIDDHKLRHGSYPRKRCTRCPRGVIKRTDMEDILIVSAKDSEPANLWAQYFAQYFEQISQNSNRKPYKIRHLGIEEIIASDGDVRLIAERTTCVKLQLIILCPQFLEKINDSPQAATSGLATLLLADRILALQLGTNDEDVTELHKEALPAFQQWQRRPVGQDQDQNFALEFVSTAIGIFTKIWKQQSSMATEENSQFSIAPKKIRYGQTSVLILLEYPLQHEDIIKISIVKNEEMTEIKTVKRRNPYTLKFTIPEKFLEVSAIVNILVEKNGSFIGKRPIKCESRLRELEQILRSTNNPIEFMCQSLGFSPHDNEQLDNWLVHMFQKNVPPNFALFANESTPTGGSKHVCELFPTLLHFAARFGLEKLTAQLLDCPGGDLACEIRNVQDFTPADIAENVGHKEINNMLRGYMKMNELAVVYTKIKKLTNEETSVSALSQAKSSISEEVAEVEDSEEHYLIPKTYNHDKLIVETDDFYKMCPAPKPIMSFMTINTKSKSAPSTPSEEQLMTLTQYISMDQHHLQGSCSSSSGQNYQNFQCPLSMTGNETPEIMTFQGLLDKHRDLELPPMGTPRAELQKQLSLEETSQQAKHKPKQKLHSSMQSIHSKNSHYSHLSKTSFTSINEDKVQVELAEIINDFKNNVHTIAQTEQLVAEWQNRNDVQKSFKEKQDQLKEMRLRYEKIQRDLKNNDRKTSPFERFKKIFGFQHQNHPQRSFAQKEDGLDFKSGTEAGRPISSLSLQSTASSSSSGRMSTISACSLGDSGTHSDHEERKAPANSNDFDAAQATQTTSMNGFSNYLIPPTPRPVKMPLMSSFPTIAESSGREQVDVDSYYIQFPPNGLPVPQTLLDEVDGHCDQNQPKSPKTKTDQYMNFPSPSCCATLCERDEKELNQHDYMNFKTVSS